MFTKHLQGRKGKGGAEGEARRGGWVAGGGRGRTPRRCCGVTWRAQQPHERGMGRPQSAPRQSCPPAPPPRTVLLNKPCPHPPTRVRKADDGPEAVAAEVALAAAALAAHAGALLRVPSAQRLDGAAQQDPLALRVAVHLLPSKPAGGRPPLLDCTGGGVGRGGQEVSGPGTCVCARAGKGGGGGAHGWQACTLGGSASARPLEMPRCMLQPQPEGRSGGQQPSLCPPLFVEPQNSAPPPLCHPPTHPP